MSCKPSCKLCNNLVISRSVTVITVDGTDTLVIDLPARTYNNCCKYCIVIAQAIPATATINMPVAFSIGGVTTTVYPFVKCNCRQVSACQIRTRTRYSTIVETTNTSGLFRSLGGLYCCPNNNLASLPVAATAATLPNQPQVPEAARASVFSVSEPTEVKEAAATKAKTTAKKEVTANG